MHFTVLSPLVCNRRFSKWNFRQPPPPLLCLAHNTRRRKYSFCVHLSCVTVSVVQQLVKVLHAQRTQVASVLVQNYKSRAKCRLSFILEPPPLLLSIFVTFTLAVARIFSVLIVAFIWRVLSALEWHSLSCRLSVLIYSNDRWLCLVWQL